MSGNRFLRWLAVILGIVIGLYGLLLMGAEDMHGSWLWIPASLGCLALSGCLLWFGRGEY